MAQIYNEQVNWKPVQEQAIAEPTRQDYLGTAFQNLGNAMEKFGEYKAQIDDAKAKAMLENTEKEAFANFEKAKDATGSYEQAYSGYINTINAALGSLDKQTYNRLSRSNPGFMGAIELKGKEQQFKMQQEHAIQEIENLVPNIARDVTTGKISKEDGTARVQELVANLSVPQQNKVLKSYTDSVEESQVREFLRKGQFDNAKTMLQKSQLGIDKYETLLNTIDNVESAYQKQLLEKEEKAEAKAADKKAKEIDDYKNTLQESLLAFVQNSEDKEWAKQYLVRSIRDNTPVSLPGLGLVSFSEKDKDGKPYLSRKELMELQKDIVTYADEDIKLAHAALTQTEISNIEAQTSSMTISQQQLAATIALRNENKASNLDVVNATGKGMTDFSNGAYAAVGNTEQSRTYRDALKNEADKLTLHMKLPDKIDVDNKYPMGTSYKILGRDVSTLYNALSEAMGYFTTNRTTLDVKSDASGNIVINGEKADSQLKPAHWFTGMPEPKNTNYTKLLRTLTAGAQEDMGVKYGTYGEFVVTLGSEFVNFPEIAQALNLNVTSQGTEAEAAAKNATVKTLAQLSPDVVSSLMSQDADRYNTAKTIYELFVSNLGATKKTVDLEKGAMSASPENDFLNKHIVALLDPSIDPKYDVSDEKDINKRVLDSRESKFVQENINSEKTIKEKKGGK